MPFSAATFAPWKQLKAHENKTVDRAAAAMLKKTGWMHQAFLTCSEKAAKAVRDEVPDRLICNGENHYRKSAVLYADETVEMKAHFIQLLRAEPGEDRKGVMVKLK